MARLFFPLLWIAVLLSAPRAATAETRYVTDQLVVTVRSGPALEEAAVTSVPTATPLEILADQGRFVQVRTPDGTTGFVLGQYLTPSPPAAVRIGLLERERDDLLQQVKRLEELRRQGAAVTPAPAPTGPPAKELAASAKERQQLEAEIARLTAELKAQPARANPLLQPEMIRWFLAGGGVFLVGWLAGKVSRKKARSF